MLIRQGAGLLLPCAAAGEGAVMELLKCKVSYSNQLSLTEKYFISFPSIFTAAALICVGEKSAFQGTAMFMTLFF